MMMLVNKDKRKEFEIMKAEQKIKKLEEKTLKMKKSFKEKVWRLVQGQVQGEVLLTVVEVLLLCSNLNKFR